MTNPMKVLLCGAAGQVGTALARTCPDGIVLSVCDSKALDISDARQVRAYLAQLKPDLILNAAAYTKVDLAESEPERAYALNAEGVRNLAQAAAEQGARLIHISTDFVFDGRAGSPYRPDAECQPLSVYGQSKLAGELLLREILPDAHLIIRTAWVYAVEGHNFVKTMLKLMQQGKALRVVNDQRGCPTWAEGLAQAIWMLAQRNVQGLTLHWSDAGEISWYEFASAIQDEALKLGLLQAPVSITPIPSVDYPTPAQRPAYSVLDCSETESLAGLKLTYWRDNLSAMLKRFNEQTNG